MSMAMRMRAAILAAAGKLAPAVAELEKQCQTHPKDVVALTQLAMLYAAQRAHDKEIATYTAILAENRDDPLVLRSRADAYLGIGKHVEAIADYERLVKVDPSDPGVLNNFAWVLATSPIDKLRNGRRAIPMANDAGRLTEYKQGHILSTMAAAYAETGDFKTAIRWSEKAVQAGAEDEQPALKKELETYKAGKPVRELLTGKEEESKPAKRKAKSAAPIKTEAKK
jgi:tetratricopeptide (TPR) repeat protein